MRRQQGRDFQDDGKKSRFAGAGAPPSRGNYEPRGGSEGRGGYPASRGGYEGRSQGGPGGSRPPHRGQDDRGGSFERSDSRGPAPRQTFRREDGAQGGYGRPSRPQFDAPRGPQAPAAQAPRPVAAPVARPVPVARLKEGVAQANRALAEVIEQFGSTLSGDYDISELEVMVSFSEDGRFIGFGAGGACTMTLSVTPLSAEEILEGENDDLAGMDEDFSDADDADDLAMDDAAEDVADAAQAELAVIEEAPAPAPEPEAEPVVAAAPKPAKKARAKKAAKPAADA